MKRFALFLAPLMAISFLTNCNSGPKQYIVTIGTCERLSFTTTDGKDLNDTKAIENQDFKFKMKVNEGSNETAYKLPTQLSIFIGNSKYSLAKDVTITETTQHLEADVTIAANQITGDIKINGSAIPTNCYEIKFFNHGVNIKSEDFNPRNPYAESSKNKDFTFVQDGSYRLPTIDDVFLEVDGKSWISPKDSTYCSYDETNHKLTINANKVNSNLAVAVRSPDYKLLESLDWNDINDCSKSGNAPTLFTIGEEKTIKVNEIDQKVRIIGFNHDELSTSTEEKKQFAGITFEFVNLLSDRDGYSLATLWNTSNGKNSPNYNYFHSDLRYALDGKGNSKNRLRWYQKESETKSKIYTEPVINMLPIELRNNIKIVKKKVAITPSYTANSYDAKVFALTYREMTTRNNSYAPKGEGTTYKYYKDNDNDSSRIKHQINWHEGAVSGSKKIIDIDDVVVAFNYAGYNSSKNETDGGHYWLASPHTGFSDCAWYVRDYGHLFSGYYYIFGNAFPVAPAFCI